MVIDVIPMILGTVKDDDYDGYYSSYGEGNGDYANNSLGNKDDNISKTAITRIIKINNHFTTASNFIAQKIQLQLM